MQTIMRWAWLALVLLFVTVAAEPALATIYWVGDTGSGSCMGLANTYDTLDEAILAAALNSANDEIRLTNTVTYNGIFGDAVLTDFHPGGTRGSLVLSGGYADCGSGQSGRAVIYDSGGDTFQVDTDSQPSSVVTFRNLEITTSGGRAIYSTGNVFVTLDNVWIHLNRAGVSAWNGAYVNMQADSVIEDNGTMNDWGGGIYCNGTDSYVDVGGRLSRNAAGTGNGANIYIGTGCYVELHPGVFIEGSGFGPPKAENGGGVYVNTGGELFSNGGNPRVLIQENSAVNGGGLYITGTGHATLLNTVFLDNYVTGDGAAIYAIDGGAPTQLTMNRVADCPFPPISCSEMQGNYIWYGPLVYVSNSHVDILHTIMETSAGHPSGTNAVAPALIEVGNGGEVRLDSINMTRNDVRYLLFTDVTSKIIMTHSTMADNSGLFAGNVQMDSYIGKTFGTFDIQNSIMTDTQGVVIEGTMLGKCNMVDVAGDWPAGPAYFIDTPVFVNKADADYRQQSNSPGVDMCLQDYFVFNGERGVNPERDLAYQLRPVNDGTNPSGMPGEDGGKYDGGFHETYANQAPDFYHMTVTIQGNPGGGVDSVGDLGIDCPGDCEEDYDQGILVNLVASPPPGNSVNWSGCDIAGGVNCSVTMNSAKNITTTFYIPGVLDFEDGFEIMPCL